jgi:hypothetical protein
MEAPMNIKTLRLLMGGVVVTIPLLLVSCGNDDRRDITKLAVIEPIPVDVPRGSDTSGSFARDRRDALELYADRDYANSRTPFAHALLTQPDDREMQLYFGSALILDGDFERALPSLSGAATSDDPIIREEGLWQLANTQLALGREQEARDALARVVDMGGRHASHARRLLDAFP